MLTDFELKILIVLFAALTLIFLRAWIQSEKANAAASREFYKEPRLTGRWPKKSPLRKVLTEIFNIHQHHHR